MSPPPRAAISAIILVSLDVCHQAAWLSSVSVAISAIISVSLCSADGAKSELAGMAVLAWSGR